MGVYVRLSKEDSRTGESVSIENQKLMLIRHVKEMGWELREIYQDDGFSGTNQNRPAFQRMMEDVKQGFINTILIKDLSRLGRNYLEVGNLAEVFLPEYGCELISLNEKLDDMMVFRNWFNEQHSKTTSAKVRIGKRISAQNGRFTGVYAPYGYKKDPQSRHKLIIDENAAPVVRKIFQMRASGLAFRAIAIKLNDENIICPKEYYYQQRNAKNPKKTTKMWSDSTIKNILKNEVYIGVLVSGKFGTVSYKNQKQVRKEKESWIRVENVHEPIIDIDTWNKIKVLAERNHRSRKRKDGGNNLFTSRLFCPDCGFRLKGQAERRERKNGSIYTNVHYMCSTFAKAGKNACSSHCISENTLIKLVVEDIKHYAMKIAFNEEKIVNAITSCQPKDIYKSELDSHIKQIDKLDNLIESLYMDKIAGIIPTSLFERQIEKYEKEREERSQVIKALKKQLADIIPVKDNIPIWTELIKKYANIDTLSIDAEAINDLIDKIIVGEAKYLHGKRVCDIKIIRNYTLM